MAELTCEVRITTENGNSVLFNTLPADERAKFVSTACERAGRVFSKYFAEHPEVYEAHCKKYGVKR